MGESRSLRLPKAVVVLGLVSFFNDFSSEMISPLLPLFITSVLGAGPAALGLIEGAADATASLATLVSGFWADRAKDRSRLVVAGYGLASVARSTMAFAPSPAAVLGIRVCDRIGKGVRTSARDALLAESVSREQHGRAYGFHRAMDNAGSVAGPLAAAGLLALGLKLRPLFLCAVAPACVTMALVAFKVRDARLGGAPERADARWSPPPPRLRGYLLVLFLFYLGQSTDAFLLLRASGLGVRTALIPILWAVFHVAKSGSGVRFGELSDKIGRRPVILAGWTVYAAAYAAFAFADRAWQMWPLFCFYGLFYGLTEGPERALLAGLAERGGHGAAFGWFNFVEGIGLLCASLLFGVLWQRLGPATAFLSGAGIAVLSAGAFLAIDLPSKA